MSSVPPTRISSPSCLCLSSTPLRAATKSPFRTAHFLFLPSSSLTSRGGAFPNLIRNAHIIYYTPNSATEPPGQRMSAGDKGATYLTLLQACVSLFCFALPCLVLPCLALLCLALLCFALLCFALLCFTLLYFTLPRFAPFCSARLGSTAALPYHVRLLTCPLTSQVASLQVEKCLSASRSASPRDSAPFLAVPIRRTTRMSSGMTSIRLSKLDCNPRQARILACSPYQPSSRASY